jgi:hypothetical protein
MVWSGSAIVGTSTAILLPYQLKMHPRANFDFVARRGRDAHSSWNGTARMLTLNPSHF